MESTRHQPPGLESPGAAGEFQRLRTDGSAAASELREFLGRMRGKSPQEMLGVVAQSGLARSLAVSAAGCTALLLLLTVVPYLLKPSAGPSAAAATAEAQPTDSQPSPAPETAAGPTDASADPEAAPSDRAVDALGIGETRTAAPDQNPLDADFDSLLDGID